MHNPIVTFAFVGALSGLLSGATTGREIAFITPGLFFGLAVAFTSSRMLPLSALRGFTVVVGSVVAYVAAEIASMLMSRFIPFSAPRSIGCLGSMAAGFVGGALLSLVVVPLLRLAPRYGISIYMALAGAGLGYIFSFVAITLADDVRLPQPLPHMAGFMIWQTGISAIIGAGLRQAQRMT